MSHRAYIPQSYSGSNPLYLVIDVVVDLGGGSKSKAYGFDGALHMALNPAYAGKAVFNADNYRNFAMAVTFNAIDWSEDGTKKS